MAGGAPDLIVRRAKIVTLDARSTVAEAVAMRGDRILAIGGDAEIAALADPDTRTIDAGGRAVIPGLIDGHAHMDREGLKGVFPTLSGCASIADIQARIAALAADAAPGEWIVTMPIGEPPFYFDVPSCLKEKRFPTRQELDEAAPDNPVYIRPIWGFWRHTLPIVSVANSMAIARAGLHPGMEAPDTITLEQDGAGALTGVIFEHTYMPVAELAWFRDMPRFEHRHRAEGLRDAMRIYNATGTTSIFEEHGCAQELIAAYQAVHRDGGMTVRAHLVFSPSWSFLPAGSEVRQVQSWAAGLGHGGMGDDWLRVEGLYAELGQDAENALRTTAAPYTGWSGFNYDHGIARERARDVLIEAARQGIRSVAIWPEMLDLFEDVNREVPIADKRWVLGHLRSASADEIARIRDLGLVMTAHTNRYVNKEGHILRDRMGWERENEISPLRSLREAGVRVGLATDNTPTTLFHPIWQAITRRNRYTNDAIAPDQALSREDALRAATIDAAHVVCAEDDKGSLEPGKLADMAILTADPLTCAEDDIRDIVAWKTIVGGTVVYDRENEGKTA
jgi:predicted amidohydrolase YtcJ